jgi:multisubunit Na+/H+ antiporter MnhB subunit
MRFARSRLISGGAETLTGPWGFLLVVLRRVVSLILWAISAFLIYAVVHAAASAGGARVGVAIGYVAGAIVMTAVGVWLWRMKKRAKTGITTA